LVLGLELGFLLKIEFFVVNLHWLINLLDCGVSNSCSYQRWKSLW